MSNAQVAAPEPKTAAEWQQKIEEYEITLAGPQLEPAIKNAIEALRADAIKRKFLAEITAPTVNVAALAQQFVTPKVPDTMPVSVAENLKMWDGQIAEVESFLKNNPPHHLIQGAESLLAREKSQSRQGARRFSEPRAYSNSSASSTDCPAA